MEAKNSRYHMTEHGVAIREAYTVTLLSAQEAIAFVNWLCRHYVELEALRRKEEKRSKSA